MSDNVYRFRRIKSGAPDKLKVLAEDFSPTRRPWTFVALVGFASTAVFLGVFLY